MLTPDPLYDDLPYGIFLCSGLTRVLTPTYVIASVAYRSTEQARAMMESKQADNAFETSIAPGAA